MATNKSEISTTPTRVEVRKTAEAQTLIGLKERWDAGDNDLYYSAEINEYLFVTDENIISVWKEAKGSHGRTYEYVSTYYWREIESLSVANLPAFNKDSDQRYFAEFYHYKIDMLFKLLAGASNYAYSYDCKPKHIWRMNDMLRGKDFKGAAEAIISDFIREFNYNDGGDPAVMDELWI
ncbi:hypothetical protein Geob_0716 [Geotalea daltonii FRC-32]|uniref:Uncharacterized protein n=1 Tax=Geotalea daltonii (strain DSM 22248 / JCM 15807 / FRC-32) TaxID=316067 RepID=B9M110_GEODF|nr:hypothetical protein [Geotalea daltonii]ACM19080.1 hypothetical protein Geob_0716 [Geotalea daltonii FRC-32]